MYTVGHQFATQVTVNNIHSRLCFFDPRLVLPQIIKLFCKIVIILLILCLFVLINTIEHIKLLGEMCDGIGDNLIDQPEPLQKWREQAVSEKFSKFKHLLRGLHFHRIRVPLLLFSRQQVWHHKVGNRCGLPVWHDGIRQVQERQSREPSHIVQHSDVQVASNDEAGPEHGERLCSLEELPAAVTHQPFHARLTIRIIYDQWERHAHAL